MANAFWAVPSGAYADAESSSASNAFTPREGPFDRASTKRGAPSRSKPHCIAEARRVSISSRPFAIGALMPGRRFGGRSPGATTSGSLPSSKSMPRDPSLRPPLPIRARRMLHTLTHYPSRRPEVAETNRAPGGPGAIEAVRGRAASAARVPSAHAGRWLGLWEQKASE